MTTVSFALNWGMASGSPVPFHVTNVLIHGAVTGLVVMLLVGLGATGSLAFLGGLAFAVHPVHVEAVANIVGRSEQLMAFFTLLALLVFQRSEWRAPLRIGLICGLFALALGSKESGVATPAFVGMLILWPRPFEAGSGDGGWHRKLIREWPMFLSMGAVLVAYLLARYMVLGTLLHLDSAAYIESLSTPLRLTTAIANFGEFARLLIIPMDLSVHYGPAVLIPAGATSLRFFVGGLLGLATLGAAVLARRRVPWVTLSVVWVASGLLVVSNLFFPIGVWVAERTLYLPSIAVSIGVVGLLMPLWREGDFRRRKLAVAALGALLLLGAVRSVTRAPIWKDSDTVAANLATEHPESYRAQWWLAHSLVEAGDLPRALRWYDSAIEVNPLDVLLRLGRTRALLLSGQADAAEQELEVRQPVYPEHYVYLAQSYIMRDRMPEAEAAVREGLARFPEDVRLLRQARELSLTSWLDSPNSPASSGMPTAADSARGESMGLMRPEEDLRVRAFLQAYDALVDSVGLAGEGTVFFVRDRPIYFQDGRMLGEDRLGDPERFDPIFYRYPLGPLTEPPPVTGDPVYSTDLVEALFGRTETQIRRHGQSVSFLGRDVFMNSFSLAALDAVEADIRREAELDSALATWITEIDIAYSFVDGNRNFNRPLASKAKVGSDG